jgi:heme/copper-type cytochrome/quinol oxidase subunit 2
MTTVDVTLGRAFRVWWSYTWRSMVLSTLVIVPVQILVITWIVPYARATSVGHGLDRPRMRELLELMWFVWPIAIVGMIIVQTIAMRWMLRRARWADFKLIVSPMDGSST